MDTHTTDEHEPTMLTDDGTEQGHIAPGVPIVRASTPRLLSYAPVTTTTSLPRSGQQETTFAIPADFPSQAPAAPPLPEEPETRQDTGEIATALFTTLAEQDELSEFAWLFEYGLEMDATYLNSPQRLNGAAKRYGPAMVKGYELHGIEMADGRIAPTLVPCADQYRQVW
ncbi:MAG TPA: hypothetical protein VGS41_06145, partial [Chthonomonadales bacterium]|nr:hypothetical protein [Chthonomonadales bacterium]